MKTIEIISKPYTLILLTKRNDEGELISDEAEWMLYQDWAFGQEDHFFETIEEAESEKMAIMEIEEHAKRELEDDGDLSADQLEGEKSNRVSEIKIVKMSIVE